MIVWITAEKLKEWKFIVIVSCQVIPNTGQVVHLIFRAKENNPEIILGRFKESTSKQLQASIKENIQAIGKEWMLWMFKRAGLKSSNVTGSQLWQHNNKPIELYSNEVIDQKVN